MPLDNERFARIAKALADPRRFQILAKIANCREVGCRRLCEQFPVAQPTMSHHLKELARAGLIEPWREGQFVYYRFRADTLREYSAALETRLGVDSAATGRRVAETSAREAEARPPTRRGAPS
jgi:ArsR family transcriptional regulator, arsenate/arsenite/antimonite-responsive transcriptional repressor